MNTRAVLTAALLLVPALSVAQRRGGGSGGKMGGSTRATYDGPGPMPNQLSNRDLEGMSPVRTLMDKKKDLALTDDQLKQLKDLDASLKAKNDSFFRQMDSLRKEMKPSDAAPEVERIRVRSVRNGVLTVVTGIRANYDAAEPDALKLLTEDQQKSANDLLAKQETENEEMLKKKLGGGRRGG